MWIVRLVNRQYIREFFHSIGFRKGKDSYTKDVPEAVYSGTRACVAAFIQGVLESDGYFGAVGVARKMDLIEHYTASPKLASSMTVLFSMFGIHAPYREEHNVFDPFKQEHSKRSGYQLQLFGNSIDLYMERIGVVSKDKCARIIKFFKNNKGRARNTNNDVLYGVKESLRAAQSAHRVGGTGSRSYIINGSTTQLNIGFSTNAADITYPELQRHTDNLNDISELAPDVGQTLRYCLKHNPRFVKVEEIKTTKSKIDVGDIEVPVSHSYIADGLVVHNCTNTELFTYGMNPETRRVRVITMSDADAVEVQRIMGDDATYRKEFLGIAKREK
jgi:hypothetical protein